MPYAKTILAPQNQQLGGPYKVWIVRNAVCGATSESGEESRPTHLNSTNSTGDQPYLRGGTHVYLWVLVLLIPLMLFMLCLDCLECLPWHKKKGKSESDSQSVSISSSTSRPQNPSAATSVNSRSTTEQTSERSRVCHSPGRIRLKDKPAIAQRDKFWRWEWWWWTGCCKGGEVTGDAGLFECEVGLFRTLFTIRSIGIYYSQALVL